MKLKIYIFDERPILFKNFLETLSMGVHGKDKKNSKNR